MRGSKKLVAPNISFRFLIVQDREIKKTRVKCRGAEAIETLNYGFINCSLTKPQVAGENR
jgi:hypothetical protein